MLAVLNFIQEVLSTPAIFVGLIALIGLVIQKKETQVILSGTIKTILGFVVLNAGAALVQSSVTPFGELFKIAFGVTGVVPNNEAIVAVAMGDFAVQTASIFALGMVANLILARFSNLKYIYLSGHCSLYLACMISIILTVAGMEGTTMIIIGALLLGFLQAAGPAMMQPTIRKIMGDDSVAIAHTGNVGYWLSAQIGKLFRGKSKSTEEISFPKTLSFLRENTVSISIVMFVCYIIVAAVAEFKNHAEAAIVFGDSNWVIFSVIESISFAAGIYVVLAGVRMLINEIVPAFKGISEKIVPNAKPALDCPIIFPFAQNAVLIGFLSSFVGGIVAMAVLVGFNAAGIAAAIILPGAVLHFFCGATAGVCGNATGGVKGCVLGSFVHGLLSTFLAAGLYALLATMGYSNCTFSDTDYGVVGIIFGLLAKVTNGTGIAIVVVVLFMLPIVYHYTIGKNKSNYTIGKDKAV